MNDKNTNSDFSSPGGFSRTSLVSPTNSEKKKYSNIASSGYGQKVDWSKVIQCRHNQTADSVRKSLTTEEGANVSESNKLLSQVCSSHVKIAQISRLQNENQELTAELQNMKKDMLQMALFYEKRLKDTENEIINAQKNYRDQELINTKAMNKFRESTTKHTKELEELVSDLQTKLSNANGELGRLHLFREACHSKEEEISDLKEEKKRFILQHKEEKDKLEHQHLDSIGNMQKSMNSTIEEIQATAREAANVKLLGLIQGSPKYMEKMSKELGFQLRLIGELQKTLKERSDLVILLKRENSILKGNVKEYAIQRYRFRISDYKLQDQVSSQRQDIEHIKQTYISETDRLRTIAETSEKEANFELNDLRQKLQEKEKQLTDIKLLAKDIIAQRSSAEKILVESLIKVKEELRLSQMYKDASNKPCKAAFSLKEKKQLIQQLLAVLHG